MESIRLRGELVFTSGVGFHDIDHEMKILIQTVAKNYAAGIMVVGPYIKEISQEWIDHAQKLNIPLMTLPYDIPVTNIISEIYRNVYNTQIQKSIEKFMTECLYEFFPRKYMKEPKDLDLMKEKTYCLIFITR